MVFAAGFLQFGYYGVNNWMPAYLESELHMNFKSMAGYMIGTYVAMILVKFWPVFAAEPFRSTRRFLVWRDWYGDFLTRNCAVQHPG